MRFFGSMFAKTPSAFYASINTSGEAGGGRYPSVFGASPFVYGEVRGRFRMDVEILHVLLVYFSDGRISYLNDGVGRGVRNLCYLSPWGKSSIAEATVSIRGAWRADVEETSGIARRKKIPEWPIFFTIYVFRRLLASIPN